ncbi:hypothetical protein K7432_007716 [Basidiobolus ranarum]
MRWRQSFRYDSILEEDFSDLIGAQKVFFHGNAKDGTPILIWRSCKHLVNVAERSREIRFYVWILVKAEQEGILTDKITIIYDRSHATKANTDLGLAKEAFPIFQRHFPERLKSIFVFPSSFLLTSLWQCIKPFIDPVTAQKIRIWKENEYRTKILEYVDSSNLLERFGGSGVETTAISIGTETVERFGPNSPQFTCKVDAITRPTPTRVT